MNTMLAKIDVYQNGIKVERVVRVQTKNYYSLMVGRAIIVDWHLQPNEVVVFEKDEKIPTIARVGL